MTTAPASGAVRAQAPRLLHRFLELPLQRSPEHAALEISAGPGRARCSVTYRELAERSAALAARIERFVQPESIVVLLLARETPELFVAQLAVSKAGAAFACIDPTLPDDYARYIVADTDAALLVTDATGALRAEALGVAPARVLVVDARDADAPAPLGTVDRARPTNLAYVIYTSGTTGRPKGVRLAHHSICNLVASDLRAFELGHLEMHMTDADARVDGFESGLFSHKIESVEISLARLTDGRGP